MGGFERVPHSQFSSVTVTTHESVPSKRTGSDFLLGVICPKNLKIEGVKQVPNSDKPTAQGKHCMDTVHSKLYSKVGPGVSQLIHFLSRVSTLTHDIDIAVLSVWHVCRTTVCPWRSGIGWKRFNMLSVFSPYGSPIILVLSASNTFTKFRRSHPCGGAKYRWGIKISRFSTNKSLYLADDTR